ncbi:MmpS family transport accessory protein [Curtobacterium sp. MCBD17_028]|uniref:MmpS family transport accessory protein n=1 Tax=Curtobacterium sp. MCBD17_028 TaxID=2175670 RepID=UPI000DAA3827|nr:MmpS family transport accessory protein [Curtobacterium sp. MCBD17_028]PZE26389.1 hypothetical protein DEI86_07785 [Curtobacterium sp. MCBD17_028]
MRKLYPILASAAIIAALAGCSSTGSTAAPASTAGATASGSTTPTATAAAARVVHYEVTSDGKTAGNVTYMTFDNGKSATSQATDAALPFEKDVQISDPGLFSSTIFSLVAQASADATTITCKITADGQTIQESTSTGAYSVATCSGSAK